MRKLILAVALGLPLLFAGQAAAWSASPTLLSCGEADFTVTLEQTPWTYTVLEDGKVVASGSFMATSTRQVSIGVRASDGNAHVVTVTVANHEARASQTALFVACGPPAPGKDGSPGKDGRDGTNGLNGKDGVTTTIVRTETVTRVEHVAPATCTSKRAYSFRVRKAYLDRKVVGVSAHEPGVTAKVSKKAGRFVVSWSTAGKTYTPGGVLRTMTVDARLAGGKKVRLVWMYRPCLAKDGNPNDPSAAGQGVGGVTSK